MTNATIQSATVTTVRLSSPAPISRGHAARSIRLNGYKIANSTLLARLEHTELQKPLEHGEYIRQYGNDMPEIRDWVWLY